MDRWLAKLEGDRFDLEGLGHWFPAGTGQALREGENVFITGGGWKSLPHPSVGHFVEEA